MNRQFKPHPRVFLIFADLDGTFTPMDISGKVDFVRIVQEIQTKEKCAVKFIPVSGRPSGYVLRVLHETRDILKEVGINDVCEYGAAEQGALMVDCKKSYGPKFTGYPENTGLKKLIAEVLAANKFADIISDEPDKLYTCSIHIKNEVKVNMNQAEQYQVYCSVRDDILLKYGHLNLNIAMAHNAMEVMTKEIKKSTGIMMMMRHYCKKYNIVGLIYAGDAENDKIAMQYVSHLSEIPGINAHNFTPGNSQDAVDTHHVEPWKRDNLAAHQHFVEKGTLPLFKGITELIRRAMDEKRLTGSGVKIWATKDDAHPQHLRDLRDPKFKTVRKKPKFPPPVRKPSLI